MVQADGCTAARPKIGVTPRTTSTIGRFASVLCLILTMLFTLGVGEMGAADVQKNAIIYMNNSASKWSYTKIYFCIDDNYGYEVSPVANTKLLVHKRTDNTWSSYSYIRFFGANGDWGNPASLGGYSNMYDYGANLSNTYNNYGFNANNYYVIKLSKAGTKDSQATLSISNPGSTIASMNKTMTIKAKISTDGGSTYSAGNTPGELTADSYEFTAYNSCSSATSATVSAGSTSSTLSVGYTANLTLEAADVEGYDFIGWSSGTNASTNVGTTNSVTVNPTAATTYYAWYREKRYQIKALTPSPSAGGSSNSPSSWTYAGQITGGSISVSANAGYDFTGWTISSGSGTFANASSTSTTFYPTADSELCPNFTTKTITVTLNGNEGTSGTATVRYNASSLTSITHASRAGYSLNGYYTASSGGNKVINADGSLNNVSGWVTGGYWSKTTNGTLYAQWTENIVNYAVTYDVHSSGHGTLAAANTSTSAAISSGDEVVNGTGVTFTASPSTGYTVDGWFSNSACTTPIANAGTGTTYSTTITAATSVYVKFKEQTWSVAFAAGTGGSVTTPAATPQTVGQLTGISIAATPSTGYTFNTWTITSGSGSFTSAATTNSNTFKPTAASTVTASFNETMSSLSTSCHYDAGNPSYAAPTVSGSATTVGYATTRTITATAAGTGYTFAGWTLTNCVRTDGGAATATSITIRSNGDGAAVTVVANYEEVLTSPWHLLGAATPFGGWSSSSSNMLQKASGSSTGSVASITINVSALPSAEEYTFKLYNATTDKWRTNAGYWVTRANNNPTLSTEGGTDNELIFKPDVVGNYTFTLDYSSANPVLTVTFPTSYTLTYDIGTVKGNNGSISTSPTTASGSKVLSGNSVTLTAPAAKTGYSWKGWYTDEEGTTGKIDDTNRAITVTMNANKTLYACYTENDYTVTVAATAGGTITTPASPATTVTAHPATTAAIVAEEAEGYYFVNWTTEDAGITIANANNKSTTITATADGTVTANFAELDKIYFRNVFDDGSTVTHWSDVYVYLGITWNGEDQAITNATHDDWRIHMTNIKGTDVWWAYVPRNFTTAAAGTKEKVGFAAKEMNGRSWTFWDTKAATRGDYNRLLNMFVPFHTAKTTGNNGVDYFDNGYWMKYDTKASQGAGYYLKKFKSKGSYDQEGEFIATNDDATFIQFKLRIDESNTTKYYMLTSAGGLNYVADAGITSANCTNVGVSENTNDPASKEVKFSLTTTSEGEYTFILNQSGDKMKLSVIYPVSVGDYRLKHTYNSGSKTTYSDVIKSGDAAEGQTLSMYLSTEESRSLVLQKCTAISDGTPIWSAGDATNLDGVLTTVGSKGNGVYQFDVKVSADKVASPAPTATKYTGSYYIKTDGGVGGWANYKQNVMDENTLNYDTDHPEKSFNYYYCKYYGDPGTNLKCVIANDYCNALTDTLVGDAVIGMGNQTTPSAASVRFSYNSYTNEIKRSYLGSSVNSDFLRILGNTAAGKPHIYDKAESTYDDSHADSYITFEDKQNWRYEIDVKADVNARAKLTATFNGQTQYFWGHAGESGHEWDNENTEELFGGESGTYGLTLVYDFKTNKLITAWKPTGATISSDLTLNSDILLLREHQGAPTTITFGQKGGSGDYASLSGVKTVYAVLRLNRWRLSNRANPMDLDTEHCDGGTADYDYYHAALSSEDDGYLPQAERELYFISFPFDVKMSDIISFGNYYDTWGIMYYDGKGRAKNGYWIDSESNWKYFTPEEFATKKLNAYEGYLIGIDLAAMAYNNTSFWTNNSCEVDIYFPSQTDVSSITQKAVDVDIDQTGYLCTINRDFGGDDGDRRIKDSYWHCIGVPSYANLSHEINNGAPDDEDWKNTSLLYLYEWNTETNEHSIMEASSFSFQAMYAYLVQYAGTTLSWAASATGPLPIAARRMKTEELRDRQFNLQLMQGDKEADHTYIRLSDDEEVTTGFEFNHDVSKMMLNGANIYTLIGTEQAAANSLPLNMEQTTVVPVGVKIATTGDYTFSIPEGTEGVGVTLIDNETGARTSLSALDYAIYLEAGTYNERFLLEISPIKLTPTSVDAVTGDGSQITDARKVMIDGLLYIVKDGVIYDARGAMVK